MISATIITLNEEENIEKAVESVKGLADEIIVVDSGSTDKTIEVAKELGAQVYHRKFDNFANQKNYAVSKARGDWILSVDADEEISADLAKEIKEAVKNNQFVGYLISRRNYILGKEIKHSRWSPDRHIWLWKRDKGRWVGEVHEEIVVLGKVGLLKSSKIHNSHKTVSEFIKANNQYSNLESHEMFRRGVTFSFWKMTKLALSEFFIRFIYKKGFLDGWRGFVLVYLMAIYQLMVWIKLWELEKNK